MKSVFIVYNQAHTERIEYIFDKLGIRGYTMWEDVKGRGSVDGVPHMGTHTWPEMNSAAMAIVSDENVEALLGAVRKLDRVNHEVGIKAFVWEILQMV